MSQLDAQHIITEVVSQLTAVFVPRFEQIELRLDKLEGRMDKLEGRMDKLESRMDKLESRMVSLEDAMDDLRSEQRLIRAATVSNLDDVMRLRDRLELRAA
jgi:chromosome segregation ATPase